MDEEQEEYELTNEELSLLGSLTQDELQLIDNWIIQNVSNHWKKVAMVVGSAILESDKANLLTEVPDVIFGARIEHMVEKGLLVSQGNIRKMRFSEIKNT